MSASPRQGDYIGAAFARAAIEAHKSAGGYEGCDDIQVWQLIVSLMSWCAVTGRDFDAICADAKEHFVRWG